MLLPVDFSRNHNRHSGTYCSLFFRYQMWPCRIVEDHNCMTQLVDHIIPVKVYLISILRVFSEEVLYHSQSVTASGLVLSGDNSALKIRFHRSHHSTKIGNACWRSPEVKNRRISAVCIITEPGCPPHMLSRAWIDGALLSGNQVGVSN